MTGLLFPEVRPSNFHQVEVHDGNRHPCPPLNHEQGGKRIKDEGRTSEKRKEKKRIQKGTSEISVGVRGKFGRHAIDDVLEVGADLVVGLELEEVKIAKEVVVHRQKLNIQLGERKTVVTRKVLGLDHSTIPQIFLEKKGEFNFMSQREGEGEERHG